MINMTEIKVEGMHCPVCVKRISEAMQAAGINAEVCLETKTVTVPDNDVSKAKEELEDLGF